MKYSILRFSVVAVSCTIMVGCVTVPEPPTERETITFDYTPPLSEITSDPKATVALVYGETNGSDYGLMRKFVHATMRDLEEIIIACGYDVKGPFKSFAAMSDAEKQESDGVLVLNVIFDVDGGNFYIERKESWIEVNDKDLTSYQPKGSVIVSSGIALVLVGSPVSEILSSKIINASPETVTLAGNKTYRPEPPSFSVLVEKDNDLYSDFGRALKTQYEVIMAKTHHYFSSADIAANLPKMEPPRTNIIFDYTPSTKASVGSTDITFAIVNAHFETPVPMFKEFAGNMTTDFQEILTENGYRIKGPFKSHDEMTYPDKEGSNLVLVANVDFSSDTSQLKWSAVEVLYEDQEYYRASGSITINCHISLILYESLTRERMWTKSLEITPLLVSILSHEKYFSEATLEGQLEEDNQFHADLGKALQSQYNEVMSKIEAYLDPREMKILAKQVRQLRKQKVFQ